VRSPSQIAPNVQRARKRALIARRPGGRFPDCLRVEIVYPVQKAGEWSADAGHDAHGAKRVPFFV